MKKCSIYFAGPWFTPEQRYEMDLVREISKYCENKYNIYFPVEHQFSTPKDTYNANVKEINNADIVVALVSYKDVGTAYELGIATALNKRIVLLAKDKFCFSNKTNIMLAFCTDTCITMDNLKLFFEDKDYENVLITNDWEGKE